MSTNKDNSGTYVGFFEGIHKAFKIIDKSFDFNARCIVLSIPPDDNPTGSSTSTACYFTEAQNINNPSIIPIEILTLEEVYRYIYNNLTSGLPPLDLPSPSQNNRFFFKNFIFIKYSQAEMLLIGNRKRFCNK